MVVSTYQAASGAGAAAMEELKQQTREVFLDIYCQYYCLTFWSTVLFLGIDFFPLLFFNKVLEGRRPTCNIFPQQVRLCGWHVLNTQWNSMQIIMFDILMLIHLSPLILQYAFNLFSHNSSVLPNGYNEEEMKLVKETRKIWVRAYNLMIKQAVNLMIKLAVFLFKLFQCGKCG